MHIAAHLTMRIRYQTLKILYYASVGKYQHSVAVHWIQIPLFAESGASSIGEPMIYVWTIDSKVCADYRLKYGYYNNFSLIPI